MALLRETLGWLDPHWDPDAALLWNPPGSMAELGPARSLHLVPQSVWYAQGLLARGDRERALRTLDAVCDLQYDEPGTPWHGTFARFAEWPRPGPGAVEWVDYDPNWRQFCGVAFAVLLRTTELPRAAADRLREAIELACAGEPPDRAGAWYTNIALKRAWLEAHHGDAEGADALRRELVGRFDAHGGFDEYNSPTYLGLDLYALALWRLYPASEDMQTDGERLEAALWRDLARWYHPGLKNLCGPYSRAYGMDANAYATLVGLWLWRVLGRDAAPFPPLSENETSGRRPASAGGGEPSGRRPASVRSGEPSGRRPASVGGEELHHGHDIAFGAAIAGLDPAVPDDAREALEAFDGERTIVQDLPGGRRATGWLGENVMLGGESGGPWPAAGQYHPATLHWRRPDGEVGWIRVHHSGPVNATASPRRLDVELPDPGETTLVVEGLGAVTVEQDALDLPGLRLRVETDAQLAGVPEETRPAKIRYTGGDRIVLRLETE